MHATAAGATAGGWDLKRLFFETDTLLIGGVCVGGVCVQRRGWAGQELQLSCQRLFGFGLVKGSGQEHCRGRNSTGREGIYTYWAHILCLVAIYTSSHSILPIILLPVQSPCAPHFKRPKLNQEGTDREDRSPDPQVHLLKVWSLGFFYIEGRENGKGNFYKNPNLKK